MSRRGRHMKTPLILVVSGLALVMSPALFAQGTDKEQPEGAVIVRNVLAKGDPLDPKTRGFHKEYLIDMESGRMYELQLGSAGKAFRPHLRVEDEAGKILEQAAGDSTRENATLSFAPLANG